ncbi:MAG: restriction endonuclease subunit S [Anaerolineales bacterium]|nr:restriction endonuclease subunit S [Anaerolineales bacterium]
MVRGFPVKGDVLFTTEAPLANVAQLDTDEKVLFAQRIIILQPQQEKIDQTFLKYLLLSQPIRKSIFSKGTGATVQGIKARLLKTIEIYFPPLTEQRAIVAWLEALSAETKRLEEIYEQKIESLEEMKKSILAKAFAGEL